MTELQKRMMEDLQLKDMVTMDSACMPGNRIAKDDRDGQQVLAEYILRNAFSEQKACPGRQSGITCIEDTGKVLYRSAMTMGTTKRILKCPPLKNSSPPSPNTSPIAFSDAMVSIRAEVERRESCRALTRHTLTILLTMFQQLEQKCS